MADCGERVFVADEVEVFLGGVGDDVVLGEFVAVVQDRFDVPVGVGEQDEGASRVFVGDGDQGLCEGCWVVDALVDDIGDE